jgi:hypothetical protein
MNKELLLKAKESILEYPDTLDMGNLGCENGLRGEKPDSRGPHVCGTTCCIMGWVMWHHDHEGWPWNSNPRNAAMALDTAISQVMNLFFDSWHKEVYPKNGVMNATAEEAARAIDHFIETDGWPDIMEEEDD